MTERRIMVDMSATPIHHDHVRLLKAANHGQSYRRPDDG
jgi:hypothetical protein